MRQDVPADRLISINIEAHAVFNKQYALFVTVFFRTLHILTSRCHVGRERTCRLSFHSTVTHDT
jgi:hypothetical protein